MKRFIILLGIIVFVCMAISVSNSQPPDPQIHVVTISPDTSDSKLKKIKVEPEIVTLECGSGDSVTWVTDGFEDPNIDFFIIFNKHGSPFDREEFGNGVLDENSGPVTCDIGEGEVKRYDYLVVVPGYRPLDPGVLIWD